jgi:hypothetical protein
MREVYRTLRTKRKGPAPPARPRARGGMPRPPAGPRARAKGPRVRAARGKEGGGARYTAGAKEKGSPRLLRERGGRGKGPDPHRFRRANSLPDDLRGGHRDEYQAPPRACRGSNDLGDQPRAGDRSNRPVCRIAIPKSRVEDGDEGPPRSSDPVRRKTGHWKRPIGTCLENPVRLP